MARRRSSFTVIAAAAILIASFAASSGSVQDRGAQPPAGRGGAAQAPVVISPEVLPDRRMVFRILASQARKIIAPGKRSAARD